MTMKRKMLRGLIAGLVGLAAAIAAVGGGGLPGSAAASCQRSIAIDPQVTVAEGSGSLGFVVRTNSCAAAGAVSYAVVNGTARRPYDFNLEDGQLTWAAGDLSPRRINVTIVGDLEPEAAIEYFSVELFDPSQTVRIVTRSGQGRILDDETRASQAVTDDRICLISAESSCLPKSPNGGGIAPPREPTVIYTIEPGHLIISPIALNQPNPAGQFVFFQTIDGGLIAGADYVDADRWVFIPPGQTTVNVEIELLEGAFSKPGQSLHTLISGYTAGTIIDPTGTVTMVV